MSLEHSPARQKKRRSRKPQAVIPVCVSINQFSQATAISRPLLYRMMADGRLKFVQFSKRMRRIPVTEYARLGLSGEETAA